MLHITLVNFPPGNVDPVRKENPGGPALLVLWLHADVYE